MNHPPGAPLVKRMRCRVSAIVVLITVICLPACAHARSPAPSRSATPSGLQQQSRDTSAPSGGVQLPPLRGSGTPGPSGLPPLPGPQPQPSRT